MSPQLERVTFSTPRDEGYTKIPTLEKMAGQGVEEFAHVVLKELIDNSLDACENADVAPEIEISTTHPTDECPIRYLTVADNGPGIPPDVVRNLCDFTTSTSDKAAYRSPARGAQGNAWPCILGIPHALGVRPATVVIEALGTEHQIAPEVVLGTRLDIHHSTHPAGRTTGTRVTVPLPASLKLDVSRWVQAYATVNPQAKFTVRGPATDFGAEPEIYKSAGHDGFRKWPPSRPTSPHWYSTDELRDLISAHLAAGVDKPLGIFVREFDGLSSTAKARKVTSAVPHISHLSGFKKDPAAISALLCAMQGYSRPVKPAALGVVPEDHYRVMLERLFGISRERFWHARKEILHNGIAWAVDVVVAATERPGRVIYAANFGIPFGDPLAKADLQPDVWSAATGAGSFLRQAGAYPDASNAGARAAVVHVQCAAPRWTDPGKKDLAVPDDVLDVIAAAFGKATKTLRSERERARKDAAKESRRQEREEREYQERRHREEREPPLKQAVRDLLGQVTDLVTEGELLTIRSLYRQVQEAAAEVTSRELTWQNFKQILSGYERDHGEIPGVVREEELPEVDLSRHPRGPEELKAAARMLGYSSYEHLLVLTRDNDPYAIGKDAEVQQGQWFSRIYSRVGHTLAKLHVRGFHYRWFTEQGRSAEGLHLDGGRYRNDQKHWQKLQKAAKIARVLGLVDPESFGDRRNKAGLIVNSVQRDDTGPDVTFSLEDWALPRLDLTAGQPPPRAAELPAPDVTGYEYTPAEQPEVLVVITEKMDDILDPVCRELGVDLLPAAGGYTSYTRAIQLLRHAEARKQPVHGFYVSDWDKPGENMPVAFARACQYFADRLGIKAEITLEPLALTREQVERYGLPKAPDKQQTELDALEGDYPGELARILRDAVQARRDATLDVRFEAAKRDADTAVAETWGEVTAEIRAGLELRSAAAKAVMRRRGALERKRDAKVARRTASHRRRIAAIQREINHIAAEVRTEFESRVVATERAAGEVNDWLASAEQQIRQLTEETEFDLPDRPEPEAEIDYSGVLYDSRRHWLDQLAAFKAAKGAPRPDAGDDPEEQAS